MVDVDIKPNIKEFEKLVDRHKDQVPFATSKAINKTLKQVRPKIIQSIKRRQKSKRSWWANKRFGINRTFADKKNLFAKIFTDIWWANLQEKGGTKVPHNSKVVAVPTNKVPKSYRKSGGARRAMGLKKTFIQDTKGKPALWRRKTKKRYPIEPLFWLRPQVIVKFPYLRFKATAERYIRRYFKKNHEEAMIQAIKTARKK